MSILEPNFKVFATDYEHCLLCNHINGKLKLSTNTRWLIHEKITVENSLVILYVDNEARQFILAFKQPKINFESTQNTLDLKPYYQIVQKAINLSREKQFSLSFTGYSFGGLLAEISLFYSHEYFNETKVKAVTFDSPGSLSYLKKISDDIYLKTYLSAPNFINTYNQHCGEMFRLCNVEMSITDSV